MDRILCGDRIQLGTYNPGSGACLMRFADAPERLLLLTAAHVLLTTGSKQNDPINAPDLPGRPIGRLRTWTTLDPAQVLADAALIWIDPMLVSPEIRGMTRPTGINTSPTVGQTLYIPPRDGGDPREITVVNLRGPAELSLVSPKPNDWGDIFSYRNQILCTPPLSHGGDSGIAVLDADNKVVGIVVGEYEDQVVITPISAILNYPGWEGLELAAADAPHPLVEAPPEAPASPSPSPVAPPSIPPVSGTGFQALKPRYEALFASCQVRPNFAGQVELHRQKVLAGRTQYEAVETKTGAPWWFVGVIHGMEAGFRFDRHLHNGDPLSARTVHVPSGLPKTGAPPFTWLASAIDAITGEKFAGHTDWGLADALYRLECYNGLAYYSRRINSPYLWSFSNQYEKGKFIADHKYDPEAVSEQCGAAVMIKALADAGDIAF